MRRCAIILAALFACAAPALAQDRVALVIGNDRYANLPADRQLGKAVNDARAVGAALEKLGFSVVRGENLNRAQMVDRVFGFTQAIKPGDTAVVFFAGHGVSLSGGNYLLPTDIPLPKQGEESRARNLALGEADIVADIQERKPRVLVMMLDACRDNPFRQPGLTRSIGGETGLARGREAEGVFSIYSAGFGQSALDSLGPNDKSPNSVFTRALVPVLARTDIHLADLVIDMREDVARLASTVGHQQFPAYYDQTRGGRVYLAGRPTPAGPSPAPVAAAAQVASAPPPEPTPLAAAAKPPVVAAITPVAPTSSGAPRPFSLRETWQRKVETAVFAAAMSPDGRLIAAANTKIHILDAETGQTIRTFSGHDSGTTGLVFSSDGKMLASVQSGEKIVRLWDPATGRMIRTLQAQSSGYNTVAFSPDGKEIAAGSSDKTVTIWDVNGRLIRTFPTDKISVRSLTFSPDGRWIATGGGYLNVWDKQSGKLVKELPGHSSLNNAVTFFADGKRLATAGSEGVKIWDIASGKAVRSMASPAEVERLALSPDERSIVGASVDKNVRVWSVETEQPQQVIGGHIDKVRAIGFSADGRRVMWGDWDGLVRVFAQQ